MRRALKGAVRCMGSWSTTVTALGDTLLGHEDSPGRVYSDRECSKFIRRVWESQGRLKQGGAPALRRRQDYQGGRRRWRTLADALHLLRSHPDQAKVGRNTYNTCLSLVAHSGGIAFMEHILREMAKNEVQHDDVTCEIVSKAYARASNRDLALEWVKKRKNWKESDICVMELRCLAAVKRSQTDALRLYNKIRRPFRTPTVYLNLLQCLIVPRIAVSILTEMKSDGHIPNANHYNAAIHVCRKQKSVSDARRILTIMQDNGVAPTEATHSIMMIIYGSLGDLDNIDVHMKQTSLGTDAFVAYIVAMREMLHCKGKRGAALQRAEAAFAMARAAGVDGLYTWCALMKVYQKAKGCERRAISLYKEYRSHVAARYLPESKYMREYAEKATGLIGRMHTLDSPPPAHHDVIPQLKLEATKAGGGMDCAPHPAEEMAIVSGETRRANEGKAMRADAQSLWRPLRERRWDGEEG